MGKMKPPLPALLLLLACSPDRGAIPRTVVDDPELQAFGASGAPAPVVTPVLVPDPADDPAEVPEAPEVGNQAGPEEVPTEAPQEPASLPAPPPATPPSTVPVPRAAEIGECPAGSTCEEYGVGGLDFCMLEISGNLEHLTTGGCDVNCEPWVQAGVQWAQLCMRAQPGVGNPTECLVKCYQ
jgi:hypothetical protein